MREVLAARSDRDFVSVSPRRGTHRSAWSAVGRLFAAALQRPGLLLGGLVIGTASAAIIVNALSFQHSRHPSPIFAKPERSVPAERPIETAPTVAPMPPSRPLSAASTSPQPTPPARGQGGDPIGDMIRASETTGSATTAARQADTRSEPQRLVASAQRALVKLGYGPLKTDGIFGPETRHAIERFERARRLTQTGELNPRTVRELTAQSGMRIE